MTRLELGIAWRYLRSRRGSKLLSFISLIAIGGVVVGVSALILVIGVMNGLQRDLREKILIGSPDIRILTYGDDMRMDAWMAALAKIRKMPGVVAAAPFVQTEAGINAGRDYAAATGVYVMGILPQGGTTPDITGIRSHAISGDFRFLSNDGRRRGIVLGKLLAMRFNAYVGSKINLISISGSAPNPITGGFVPRVHEFEVTGIFETGGYEYDNAYAYIDIGAAQEFAGLGDAVTGVEIRTPDRWQAETVGRAITQALGDNYRAVDWQEQNRSLFQALKIEKIGMGVILLLIVIVAAFNIVSTLTMVVNDKTREIGILKAMGMRSASVRRIFFVQGVVIGAVGTGLGVLLGFAGALALDKYKFIRLDPQVYFIDHLPIAIQVVDVLWIILASLAIAALATLYPSIQAARMYPVDAIRSE